MSTGFAHAAFAVSYRQPNSAIKKTRKKLSQAMLGRVWCRLGRDDGYLAVSAWDHMHKTTCACACAGVLGALPTAGGFFARRRRIGRRIVVVEARRPRIADSVRSDRVSW